MPTTNFDRGFGAFAQGWRETNVGGAIQRGMEKGIEQQLLDAARKDEQGFRKKLLEWQGQQEIAKDDRAAAEAKRKEETDFGYDVAKLGISRETQYGVADRQAKAAAAKVKPEKYEPILGDLPFKMLPSANPLDMGRMTKVRDYDQARADFSLDAAVTDKQLGRLYTMPKGEKRDKYLEELQSVVGEEEPGGAAVTARPNIEDRLRAAGPDMARQAIESSTDDALMATYGVTKAEALAAWQRIYGGAASVTPSVASPMPPPPRPVTTQSDFSAQRGR